MEAAAVAGNVDADARVVVLWPDEATGDDDDDDDNDDDDDGIDALKTEAERAMA